MYNAIHIFKNNSTASSQSNLACRTGRIQTWNFAVCHLLSTFNATKWPFASSKFLTNLALLQTRHKTQSSLYYESTKQNIRFSLKVHKKPVTNFSNLTLT